MSYRVKIHGWSGNNLSEVADRFAKLFRMRRERALTVLHGIVEEGRPWQFERSIPDRQGNPARQYLKTLGFDVELALVEPGQAVAAKPRPAREELSPPAGPAAPKSLFGFLKRPLTPQPEEAVTPAEPAGRKPFFSFGRKPREEKEEIEEGPGETAPETPAKKPLFGFLKRSPAPPPEEAETPAEPSERKPFFSFGKKRKETSEQGPEEEATAPYEETDYVSSYAAERAVSPPTAKTQPRASGLALGILLVLLLGTGAGLPYWFGGQAETTFNDFVAGLSRKNVQVTVKNYARGWLESTAEYVVRAPDLPFSPAFDVSSRIVHGPVSLEDWLAGNAGGEFFQARIISSANLTLQNLKTEKPLRAEATQTVPLSGDGEIQVSVKPYQSQSGDLSGVNWLGMEGNATFSGDLGELRGTFNSKPLVVHFGEEKVSLNKIAVNLNSRGGGPARLPLGDFSAVVDQVKAEGPGQPGALLRQIKFFTSTHAAPNDNINVSASLQAEEIKAGEDVFGPGIVKVSARNLDAATLLKIRKLGQGVRQDDPASQGDPSQQALELFGELAKKVPELEIVQLSLKTPKGELVGHAKAAIDGSSADLGKNPLMIFEALDLSANFTVPGQILRDLVPAGMGLEAPAKSPAPKSGRAKGDDFLDQWAREGYLLKEGDQYKIELLVKKGKVAVNGRPMEQFLPMMMPPQP
ncbi:MAG: YdgA family protein [Nitrospinae bacterium]|nr:YdgA family protein [Nitrospinota bacterium]